MTKDEFFPFALLEPMKNDPNFNPINCLPISQIALAGLNRGNLVVMIISQEICVLLILLTNSTALKILAEEEAGPGLNFDGRCLVIDGRGHVEALSRPNQERVRFT
jgi:hypothetical protein